MLQKAQNLILKKKRVEAKLRKELEEEAKATDVRNRQNEKNAQKERAETEKKEAEKKKAATEKKAKAASKKQKKEQPVEVSKTPVTIVRHSSLNPFLTKNFP